VLAFAGTDPSGGAGLQADVLTLAARGCHPLSVVTAITVQDTTGVAAVQAIAAGWVTDQARRALADMRVSAIKIGLVGSAENAAAIAAILADHSDVPVVLDPVLASGRGDALASADAVAALCELLVPRATVLTPNSLEARRLAFAAERGPDATGTLAEAAQRLLARGAEYVLVTGTHEPTPQVINTLYGARGMVRSDHWERLPGSYHGSGCTLAAAIAAGLASGHAVAEAVRAAQRYVWQALAQGFRPGAGQHIPDRLVGAQAAASAE